ncbi:MAG: hypothetical protein ACRBBN_12610 [Methyloligellaceae bacterium]
MKKLLLATALLMGSSAVAIAADSASSTISLSGTVAETCYITSSAAQSHTYSGGGSLAHADTAVIRDQDKDFTFGDSYCNAAFKMQLSSANGAITSIDNGATSATGAFASFVDYTATAQFGTTGSSITLDTSDIASTGAVETATSPSETTGAERGTLKVNVDIDGTQQSGNPLLAGSYSDTLTVMIGTNL